MRHGVSRSIIVLVYVWTGGGRSLPDLVTTPEELNHLDVGFVSLALSLDLTTATERAIAGQIRRNPEAISRQRQQG